MAIAFDAANSGTGSDTTTVSFSITAASGAAVVVGISGLGNGSPSTVTYNGSAMTLRVGAARANAVARLYANTGVGTGGSATVAVTLDANDFFVVGATSWTGVDTISATTQTATGVDATPTLSIASASGEVVVDCLSAFLDGATVDASQTQRYNAIDGSSVQRGAGSSEAGAGSVTMSWSKDNTNDWALAAIALQASAAATVDGPLIAGLQFSRIRRF